MVQSWRLKVDRAEKHLHELEAKIRTYADGHPYEAIRARHAKKDTRDWAYLLRVTKQPDPRMAIVCGDVVHNLRSAYDHLAVAIAPRSRRWQAGFPIELEDIWEKDEGGVYIVADDNRRASYLSRTTGMPKDALTIIDELQPYNARTDPKHHPLAIISRLDNADKHRELLVVAVGLGDVRTETYFRGRRFEQALPEHPKGRGFAQDGTQIAGFLVTLDPPPDESEVQVKVYGTPVVALDIGLEDGYAEAVETLANAIELTRSETFAALEPFARSGI